jgi:hypothetical protein
MQDIITAVLQHDDVYSHLLPWLLGPSDAALEHTHADLVVQHLSTARLVVPITAAVVRVELITFISTTLSKLIASGTTEGIESSPVKGMAPRQEQGRPIEASRGTLGKIQRRPGQVQSAPMPTTSQTAPKGAWGKPTPAKQLFASQHQQRATNGRMGDILTNQRTPGTPVASSSQPQGSAASTPGSSAATSYATASSARHPMQDLQSGPPQIGTPQASRCSSSSTGQHFRTPVSSQVSIRAPACLHARHSHSGCTISAALTSLWCVSSS